MINLNLITVCKWDNCNHVFNTPNDCYYHVRKTHLRKETKICLWEDCNMECKNRCNLTNHLLSHIQVINGVCYLCNREFKWRCDYKKHLKKHTEPQNKFNELVSILFK